MKKETRPVPESLLKHTEVENLIFGKVADGTLRRMGFRPRDVDNWAVAIFKGNVPAGFENLDEFEKHVLSIIERKRGRIQKRS